MRKCAPLLLLCLSALSACQQAAAATNDEMARCIAAIEFGKHYWRDQSPPNHYAALGLTAQQIFYVQKLKAAGVPDGGMAQAAAFAEEHGDDAQFMTDFLHSCGAKLLKHPEFERQIPALVALAMKVDPICRANPGACAKP